MKIINLEQGSEKWEEFRRDKIGSSDSPVICGVSPYKNPTKLWNEKMGYDEVVYTYSMDRGKSEEERVRPILCELYESDLLPLVAVHDDYTFIMASFDGIDMEKGVLIEIKYTNEENYNRIMSSKECPLHFVYQVQHALFVSGLKSAHLCLTNGKEYHIWDIEEDEEIQEKILENAKKFYNYLKNWEKPPGTHVERPDLEDLMIQMEKAQKMVKHWENEFESLKDRAKAEAHDVSISAGPFRLTKITQKGNVDYKKIPELSDVDLEKYRKPSYDKWVFYCPKDEPKE